MNDNDITCINFIANNYLSPDTPEFSFEDFPDHITKNDNNIEQYLFYFDIIEEIFAIFKDRSIKKISYERDIFPVLDQRYTRDTFQKKINVKLYNGIPVVDNFNPLYAKAPPPGNALIKTYEGIESEEDDF
jgi:hypothetical protein